MKHNYILPMVLLTASMTVCGCTGRHEEIDHGLVHSGSHGSAHHGP